MHFAVGMDVKYCDIRVPLHMFVRMPVCPRPYLKIQLSKLRGRGLVISWQCCDMLCTSGFADDVLFAHNRQLSARQRRHAQGVCSKWHSWRQYLLSTSCTYSGLILRLFFRTTVVQQLPRFQPR